MGTSHGDINSGSRISLFMATKRNQVSTLMDQRLEVLNLSLVLYSTIQPPVFFFIKIDMCQSGSEILDLVACL